MVARWVLAAAYLAAGYLHIAHSAPFLRIMPPWVPFPRETVIATGLCELFGAIGLLIPRTRWWAGLMLALYALCVWPANMQHAINDLGSGTGLPLLYHAPRLLAQPLIIWWALYAGKVTDWPFGRRL
ncbi:DoxX family protein [Sphingomonas sp. AP4-R1]|uniref:DoxX family protein n=1 Tax=Sphingomonas sp. AP4-R1 TaxID=2735134 RepID=UPI001C120F9F|nr:DoxX family protein [Sphingomonas sp. AP4-R1]